MIVLKRCGSDHDMPTAGYLLYVVEFDVNMFHISQTLNFLCTLKSAEILSWSINVISFCGRPRSTSKARTHAVVCTVSRSKLFATSDVDTGTAICSIEVQSLIPGIMDKWAPVRKQRFDWLLALSASYRTFSPTSPPPPSNKKKFQYFPWSDAICVSSPSSASAR